MDFSITKTPKWFAHIPSPPHWVAWLFYFLIAYVLSVGPAAWINYHHPFPPAVDSSLNYFYFPLNWLTSKSPTFQACGEWYIHHVWRLP